MGFWKACCIKGTGFYVAITIFRWSWKCERRTSFWKTLCVKNERNCDQSEDFREVLEWLKKSFHRVWSETADTWMLHHDNAPCHTANSVNEFLNKKGIPVFSQPPYSPDLSPCDLFLFPKLKFHPKGRHFATVDNIQKVVTEQLSALPHEDFQQCYRVWEQRLRGCGLPKGTILKGIMLICNAVNKKFYNKSHYF